MRIVWALAIMFMVAACSSSTPEPVEAEAPDAAAAIPDNLYQPTVHAILALSGGYGLAGSEQGIDTVWRRAGANQTVRLRLSPETVTVQTMLAGRYVLDSVVVEGRELLIKSSADSKASPVSDVLLDPGEVIYVGDLLFRERAAKNKKKSSKKNVRQLVIRVRSNADKARRGIAAKHGDQSSLMKIRLLRGRK